MRDILTMEAAKRIVNAARELDNAQNLLGATEKELQVSEVYLDLSTEVLITKPFKISFPFRSIFVEDATDTTTTAYIRLNSDDSIQSSSRLDVNTSIVFPTLISEAYIHYSAQSGKFLRMKLYTNGEYRSGKYITVNSGGVSINDGSGFTNSQVVLTAATASLICAVNGNRKISTFENETGADIFVGGSTVSNTGANKGRRVPPGAVFDWRNTSALYGYSVSGGTLTLMEET